MKEITKITMGDGTGEQWTLKIGDTLEMQKISKFDKTCPKDPIQGIAVFFNDEKEPEIFKGLAIINERFIYSVFYEGQVK